jgi:uncharacterized protein YwqG
MIATSAGMPDNAATIQGVCMAYLSKIQFTAASAPIVEAVTKFGGQPVWIAAPQWPLSRETGNPMRFIGQIALDGHLFAGGAGKMAYIFMTDEEAFVDGTYEADGGENAVIIQPDGNLPVCELVANATGPTLSEMVEEAGTRRMVEEDREYAVQLKRASEPDFVDESARDDWTEEQFGAHAEALDGNKIGGSPLFLQADEFPDDGPWKLLLQLDSSQVPFPINFGDAGIAYIFIDPSLTTGKMLWQCG